MAIKIIRAVFWSTRLAQVVQFIKEHGRLPVKNSSDPLENVLANWRLNNVAALKKGPIDKKRVAALEKSGILFDPNEKAWDEQRERTSAFVKSNGRFPSRSGSSQEERVVGRWRSEQVGFIKRGELSEERKEKFINSGMYSTIYDQRWRLKLKEAVRFKKKHGWLPRVNGDTIEEVRLGIWCRNVRVRISRGLISGTRKSLAVAAGIMEKSGLNAKWKRNYDRLVAFCESAGHLPAYDGSGEELLNYRWYKSQLTKNNSAKAGDDRRALIFDIRKKYRAGKNTDDDKWRLRYQRVSLFIERNGRPPSWNKKQPFEFKLATWLYRQQQLIKKGHLSATRKELISRLHPSIGDLESWSAPREAKQEKKWEKNYDYVYNYVKRTGFMPDQLKGDTVERKMYPWLLLQRQKAKSNTLDQGKMQKILSLVKMISMRKSGPGNHTSLIRDRKGEKRN